MMALLLLARTRASGRFGRSLTWKHLHLIVSQLHIRMWLRRPSSGLVKVKEIGRGLSTSLHRDKKEE